MIVKVKKLHKDAVVPKYAKIGDAGLDLTAISKEFDSDGNVVYDTGLAIELPEGYVALLFPRSSNSKKELSLSNSVGVTDSGYRGSLILKFKPTLQFSEGLTENRKDFHLYEVGERVAQMVILPYPQIELEEVDELSPTERGMGGYGSTGK